MERKFQEAKKTPNPKVKKGKDVIFGYLPAKASNELKIDHKFVFDTWNCKCLILHIFYKIKTSLFLLLLKIYQILFF